MIEPRQTPARIRSLCRRHDQGGMRPPGSAYEAVDADFDDLPLDDLRRQADTGRIDVADL